MNVTIIGAGNMAKGIASRLLAGGNPITIIDRHSEKAESLAKELGKNLEKREVKHGDFESEINDDIVILAITYSAVPDVIKQFRNKLVGRILIDITNPLNNTYDGLVTPPQSSAAEELEKIAPREAKIIKAFNTVFAATLLDGKIRDMPLDVFVAGDDPEAKSVVIDLIESGGMRPIDSGGLQRARQLEQLALLHIVLQESLGTQFRSGLKIIS